MGLAADVLQIKSRQTEFFFPSKYKMIVVSKINEQTLNVSSQKATRNPTNTYSISVTKATGNPTNTYSISVTSNSVTRAT